MLSVKCLLLTKHTMQSEHYNFKADRTYVNHLQAGFVTPPPFAGGVCNPAYSYRLQLQCKPLAGGVCNPAYSYNVKKNICMP